MQTELNEREKRIFVDMPAVKSVLKLALPTVVSQVISVIYNLADTYYIGKTNNPDMVAAVAINMTLMLMMTGMANLFGIGGSSVIARCLGAKDFARARKASAFAASLFVFSEPAMRLLGATDDTIGYCYSYVLWVCMIGGLPAIMSALLAHLVRSEGASKQASFGISMAPC